MRQYYNIYCDETCHLEHDNSKVMVLGAAWCTAPQRYKIFNRIRDIKGKYKLKPTFEMKWNKVSEKKLAFYEEVIDYFFDDHDLHFRAIVIPDKTKLNHAAFSQDHDSFIYKVYFHLLKVILEPDCSYNIYLDMKDTKSENKVGQLKEVLRNNHYDYAKEIVKNVQQVRAHEIEIMQIADILSGAISYVHRDIKTNKGKLALIKKIKERSGYGLAHSTLYKEDKLNLFIWKEQTDSFLS